MVAEVVEVARPYYHHPAASETNPVRRRKRRLTDTASAAADAVQCSVYMLMSMCELLGVPSERARAGDGGVGKKREGEREGGVERYFFVLPACARPPTRKEDESLMGPGSGRTRTASVTCHRDRYHCLKNL